MAIRMQKFPKNLLNGYQNFMSGRYDTDQARYKELAKTGQKPQTMVIACCDSRSAPEVVFDSGPGEMFVVRNVANLVPPYSPDDQYHGTSAALEFAVQSLKIREIVVMGHGRCGGISAALASNFEPLSSSDFIGNWVEMLKPAAESIKDTKHMTDSERQTVMERISVRNSIENLRTFPCVKELEDRGTLNLHGAWFDISSGELWIMDHETGDFVRPNMA